MEARMEQENIREEIRSLLKESTYMTQKAMVLPCQKKCLSFQSSQITQDEAVCLQECLDKMSFFDNATYELDSASVMASQQGKPKKAFMYYNRRIADLTTPLDQ